MNEIKPSQPRSLEVSRIKTEKSKKVSGKKAKVIADSFAGNLKSEGKTRKKSGVSQMVQWINGHPMENGETREAENQAEKGASMVQWLNGAPVDFSQPAPQEKPRKPMTGTVSYHLGKPGQKGKPGEMVQWVNGHPLKSEPEGKKSEEDHAAIVQWVAGKPLERKPRS